MFEYENFIIFGANFTPLTSPTGWTVNRTSAVPYIYFSDTVVVAYTIQRTEFSTKNMSSGRWNSIWRQSKSTPKIIWFWFHCRGHWLRRCRAIAQHPATTGSAVDANRRPARGEGIHKQIVRRPSRNHRYSRFAYQYLSTVWGVHVANRTDPTPIMAENRWAPRMEGLCQHKSAQWRCNGHGRRDTNRSACSWSVQVRQ